MRPSVTRLRGPFWVPLRGDSTPSGTQFAESAGAEARVDRRISYRRDVLVVPLVPFRSMGQKQLHDEEAAANARGATEFFGPLVPGQLGCVFDHAAPELVVGHIDVTPALIAGTGFLFAPAVVALADTCAAIGCGHNVPEGSSFTTIELKSNFLSSARVGERVVCRCTPAHIGRQTHVWDAEVTNESTGRTMALFRCTQMVLHPK